MESWNYMERKSIKNYQFLSLKIDFFLFMTPLFYENENIIKLKL